MDQSAWPPQWILTPGARLMWSEDTWRRGGFIGRLQRPINVAFLSGYSLRDSACCGRKASGLKSHHRPCATASFLPLLLPLWFLREAVVGQGAWVAMEKDAARWVRKLHAWVMPLSCSRHLTCSISCGQCVWGYWGTSAPFQDLWLRQLPKFP